MQLTSHSNDLMRDVSIILWMRKPKLREFGNLAKFTELARALAMTGRQP